MTDERQDQDRREDIEGSQAEDEHARRLRSLGQQDLRKALKPKKKSKLAPRIIALAVLVAVAAGAMLLLQDWRPAERVVDDKTVTLLGEEMGEVESVTFAIRGEEPYTIYKDKNTIPISYKIAGWSESIALSYGNTFAAFASGMVVRAEEVVEEDAQNLAQYGLDDPLCRMTSTLTNGQQFTFLLGNRAPTGLGYYLMEEGSTTVYRVSDYTGTNMTTRVNHMRDLSEILAEIMWDYADYVMIKRGEETIEIRKGLNQVTLNAWQMISPTYMEAATSEVMVLAEAIGDITLLEYVDTTSNLAQYGLEEPMATMMIKDTTGARRYLAVGDAHKDNASMRYVCQVGTQDVYAVNQSDLSFLETTTLSALVERYFAMVNINTVDKMQYVNGADKYDISIRRTPALDVNGKPITRNDGTQQTRDEFIVNGKSVMENAFRKIYQAMIGLVVAGEVREEVQGEATGKIEYSYIAENVDPLVIHYTPYQKDFYAVAREGSQSMFYTRASIFDSIRELFKACVAMPREADAENVESITITKDGQSYGFERQGGQETYRGKEVAQGRVAAACLEILAVPMPDYGTARLTTDVLFTIEFDYGSAREPIVLEYRNAIVDTYAVTVAGQDAYFLVTKPTMDAILANYELTSGATSGITR